MSESSASPTSPSSPGSVEPSPSESSQNRKPDPMGVVGAAASATLRESGRGVSPRSGDRSLSNPSTLTAVTEKQRGTPFSSAPARNSGATVVPSTSQSEPQSPVSISK